MVLPVNFLKKKKKEQKKEEQAQRIIEQAPNQQPGLTSFPTQEPPKPKEKQKETSEDLETFTNEQGTVSGVTLPDGRTFLGLKPDDIRKIREGIEKKTLVEPKVVSLKKAAETRGQLELIEQEKLKREGLLASPELAPTRGAAAPEINEAPLLSKEALLSSLGAGAAAGTSAATASALTGVGATAAPVIGVTAGAVGFAGTILAKVTIDQRENVQEAKAVWKQSEGNMNVIINRLKTDVTYTPEQAVKDWSEELYNIEVAEINLNNTIRTPIKKSLSGGGPENIEFNLWKEGVFPSLQSDFNRAFLQPIQNGN